MAEKLSRVERVKELSEMLDNGIRELFENQSYVEYLRYMKTFHKYSANNIMLIAMQYPEATLVKGYKAWGNDKKVKRTVKKGEKAIWILAPMSGKKTVEKEEVDENTGEVKTVEVEKTYQYFRGVAVYDILQTEGDPLPRINPSRPMVEYENYDVMLNALIKTSKFPVHLETMPSSLGGYFDPTKKLIKINTDKEKNMILSTLVHEITHSILHNNTNTNDRQTEEVEAESVAFIVSEYFGIDTSNLSFKYVAGWSKDKELKVLYASLKTIQKTACELIETISDYLMNKEKKLA